MNKSVSNKNNSNYYITPNDMQNYTSEDDLEFNCAYLFYGKTSKGAAFFVTGYLMQPDNKDDYNEPESKNTKKKKKPILMLDQESWRDTPKITKYLKLGYE